MAGTEGFEPSARGFEGGFDDDSPADTDDEYTQSVDYNFDDVTDEELEDLLDKILEALELLNPDLSSLEGLLKAIYNRLGTLDSDNDAPLLSALNSAILSLMKSNQQNSDDLVEALLLLRDDLKNGTVGSEHDHEINGTLYNVKPLDKNWLNKLLHDKENLKVEYEGKIYYLEDCGCLKLGEKYYRVDMNYDSYTTIDFYFSNEDIDIDRSKYVDVDFSNYNVMWASLSSSQQKKIDSVIDLIYKLVSQSIPYFAIKNAFSPFEGVMFNVSSPDDIVLTIDSVNILGYTVDGFSVTILSTSFFDSSGAQSALRLVRGLVTVIIGYSWLIVMRRKVVAMI